MCHCTSSNTKSQKVLRFKCNEAAPWAFTIVLPHMHRSFMTVEVCMPCYGHFTVQRVPSTPTVSRYDQSIASNQVFIKYYLKRYWTTPGQEYHTVCRTDNSNSVLGLHTPSRILVYSTNTIKHNIHWWCYGERTGRNHINFSPIFIWTLQQLILNWPALIQRSIYPHPNQFTSD